MDLSVTDFNVRLRTIRLRDVIVAGIISFIITIVLAMVIPSFEGSDDLLFTIFLLLTLLFFIWSLRGTYGLRKNFSGIFDRNNSREIFYVFVLNFIFALFAVAFFTTFDALINPVPDPAVDMIEMGAESMSALVFILEFISTIILAPVLEELLFRGVLFNRLKIRTGVIASMLISSFLFAIGHEFGGIISAFVFGMCMCVIYLKTDNILLTMSIHFINNLLASLLDFTDLGYFLLEMPMSSVTLIVSAMAGILLIVYIYKNLKAFKHSV